MVLHELLTSEPELYVQVLSDVYKAASDSIEREPTEDQTRRATMGYRLLQSMRTVPGADDTGGLDGAPLRRWVLDVRELAARADRAEVCDHHIGRLLAYAPNDGDDHAWPHRAVRNLLEEVRSDAIESSMQSEQIAKRGAHFKELFGGGAQERGKAQEAREWARASRDWPRTSALLERIAEMWEQYAVREDEEAEKRKARFG
jgi:hypothetical protein